MQFTVHFAVKGRFPQLSTHENKESTVFTLQH
jgi:hypothetical protein